MEGQVGHRKLRKAFIAISLLLKDDVQFNCISILINNRLFVKSMTYHCFVNKFAINRMVVHCQAS